MTMSIDGSAGLTFPNSSVQAYAGGLGSNTQTWQDVTASRATSTTYTNSTGYPIQIMVGFNAAALPQIVVSGVTVWPSTSYEQTASVIIPTGATYSNTGGAFTKWFELR